MERRNTSIILFAHGSTVAEANAAIARLAEDLARVAGLPATPAFLDVAQPDLPAAVSDSVRAGARTILIVPCFLVLGMHVRQDLPRLVEELEASHPGVEIRVSQPLEGHPGLAEILASRVREVLSSETLATAEQGKG